MLRGQCLSSQKSNNLRFHNVSKVSHILMEARFFFHMMRIFYPVLLLNNNDDL